MSVPSISLGLKMDVDEVISTDRVGIHSHITGLGLDEHFNPLPAHEGLIGQTSARRAAGITVRMVQEGKIAGRCVLIAGPPSTGKTALATAMAHTIGPATPFNTIAASEVFSLEMSKTEALTQAFRRSIAVKITEDAEVIEGEVVSIDVERPSTDPTLAKQRSGQLVLKTADMESAYDLGGKLIDALQREGIHVGDVISISRANGRVTRLGRSYAHARDLDVQSKHTRFVPCPKGELAYKKSVTHTVSLHDVDVINSRPQGYQTLFAGDTGEITSENRSQIDEKIDEWVQDEKASIILGVLFIDEAHMLDMECFSWLNRALESPLAPLVILATNRERAEVRGTDWLVPYGIPSDLLDRTLVISTNAYAAAEMRQIITLRGHEESVDLEPAALKALTEYAQKCSLRYALQLVTTGSLACARDKRERVSVEDVQRMAKLFLDVDSSAAYLKEHAAEYTATSA